MSPAPDRSYTGVQALRGLAAMLVVLCHCGQMVNERLAAGITPLTFGAAGVDLFFPISGFVMTVTTYRYWGQAGRATEFLLRRLARIAPMYWAATLLKLLALLALPAMASRPNLDGWHVLSSFLFIPAYDGDHRALPLISVGWTLHFEMLFYALFAAALALRLKPVWWVGIVLAVFSFLPLEPLLGAVGTLANPILLEFVAGMLLGYGCVTGRMLPMALAPACLVASLLALPLTQFIPAGDAFMWRPLVWGIPGALALAAVVTLEPRIAHRLTGWPVLLGDASYAIYLVHGFVLPPLGAVLARLHLTGGVWPVVAIAVGCVVSAIAGVLVHLYAEKPVTAWLNERLRRRRATQLSGAT